MQTNTNKKIESDIILQARNLTKLYKCEKEEENIISLIGFIKKREGLGIRNISLDIYKNRIIGLVGEKKCGKSTLLKILSGVLKPSSGSILCNDTKVNDLKLREMVSYITKEPPNSHEYGCTLLENIIQYACRDNKNRCDVVDKAEKLVKDFQMSEYRFKEVIKLPNAIRNRMFILRGLLSHKKVLCFDQPLTYVGESQTETFVRYLRELAQNGKAIVLTSDDLISIDQICDEIIKI